MSEKVMAVLAFVGAVAILTVFLMALIFLLKYIGERVDDIMDEYRYKHRFGKPPTANCYCRDCMYHDDKTCACSEFSGYVTADNWFCWSAKPRKHKAK